MSTDARIRLTTIVGIDVAGYSARTEADSEAAARDVMALRARISDVAARHGGRIFNTAGDGLMIEFAAAREAIAAIFELVDKPPEGAPAIRIGAHLGDVTEADGGDLLGHGVNVAARLLSLAEPGRALISQELKAAMGPAQARPMRAVGEVRLAKMTSKMHAFEIASEARAPNYAPRMGRWLSGRRLLVAGVAAAILLLGTVATVLLTPLTDEAQIDETSLTVSRPVRLAILPFANLSPDPDNAYFADGMHEEILSTLSSRAKAVDIISRTTMMTYRDAPKAVPAVATELRATHVLEGTLRREGDEVRLTLQLIDGENDRQIWSRRYDRTIEDALTLQSDVAREVADQLAIELGGGPAGDARPTTSPRAYELYLKARVAGSNLHEGSTQEEIGQIEALLTQAIQIDPDFGLAYVARGWHYESLGNLNFIPDEESRRRVQADLEQAKRLLPGNGDVIMLEVSYLFSTGRAEGADAYTGILLPMVEAAEAAGVSDRDRLPKALLMLSLGRYEEALAQLRKLIALDPGNFRLLLTYQKFLRFTKQEDEALDVLDQLIRQFHYDSLQMERARLVFEYTGRTEDLRRAFARYGGQVAQDSQLMDEFNLLRYEQRFADLKAFVDSIGKQGIRYYGEGGYEAVGPIPISLFRGWAALLAGDAPASAKQGQLLKDYVASAPRPPIGRWYWAALSGQAHLFTGDFQAAKVSAREALSLGAKDYDTLYWIDAAPVCARILAWAGAEEEAVDILERLANEEIGLAPADIARDPFFTIPLADNTRFQALAKRMEAQMTASDLR